MTAFFSGATAQESRLEPVIVTGHPLSRDGIAAPVDVLAGEELARAIAGTIGETLGDRPGIRSAPFGRAVGRPVIHGLGGPRVRVLQDRIDTLDLSSTSGDHAVSVDPFVARRIEIIKGSGSLLYGLGAIGGVIDVQTGRVPRTVPEAISGGGEIRYGHNGNRVEVAAKLDGSAGLLAWHADGAFQRGDPYSVPGLAESRRQLLADGEDPAAQELVGALPGTQYLLGSGAGGMTWVGETGFVGVAVSGIGSSYGLPGHSHEEEDEEAGAPTLDLRQVRVDAEAGIDAPLPGLTAFNFRAGFNDYAHTEQEPDGQVGTRLASRGWDTRAEALRAGERVDLAVGVHHTGRDFTATGDEAYVPPATSVETGVFAVGELDLELFSIEGGVRLGHVGHRLSADAVPPMHRQQLIPAGSAPSTVGTDFFVYAVSVGGIVPLTRYARLAINLERTSRAPMTEELYAEGSHAATASFEIGNPSLPLEEAVHLSASADFERGSVSLSLTGYAVWFQSYIYRTADGSLIEGEPVLRYGEDAALFAGVDVLARWEVWRWASGWLSLSGDFDYVSATRGANGEGSPLPRIPPLRVGVGAEMRWRRFDLGLHFRHIAAQDRVGASELPTDAWNDLGLHFGYTVPGPSGLRVFFNAENLTNAEQRPHTSFVKDFVPLPGLTLNLGLRLEFSGPTGGG